MKNIRFVFWTMCFHQRLEVYEVSVRERSGNPLANLLFRHSKCCSGCIPRVSTYTESEKRGRRIIYLLPRFLSRVQDVVALVKFHYK